MYLIQSENWVTQKELLIFNSPFHIYVYILRVCVFIKANEFQNVQKPCRVLSAVLI